MDFKAKNWVVIITVVIVTYAILGGGQMLWQKFAVAKPLDTALQDINGVEKVVRENGSKKEDPVKINVTLKNVANLEKTYTGLMEGSANVLGSKRFKLTLTDSRSPELEQFNYQIQPHIQEAMATGAFTQMVNKINEQASAKGITAQVFIDNRNIYLQLTKDGAELYHVAARYPASQEVK